MTSVRSHDRPAGDVLEAFLPAAADLVVSVHDRDAVGVARVVEPLAVQQLRALLVVTAALVPDHQPLGDLLAWTHHDDRPTLPEQDQLPFGEIVLAEGEKWCNTCEQVRLRGRDFHVDNSRPDGLKTQCRSCRADRRLERLREAAA